MLVQGIRFTSKGCFTRTGSALTVLCTLWYTTRSVYVLYRVGSVCALYWFKRTEPDAGGCEPERCRDYSARGATQCREYPYDACVRGSRGSVGRKYSHEGTRAYTTPTEDTTSRVILLRTPVLGMGNTLRRPALLSTLL